jgi:hypothetical protein
MRAPDIKIDLNSGGFAPVDSQELVGRVRAETGLRVEGDLFDYYSEGSAFPPEVILNIVYTLFPLGDLYAAMLSSMLWDAAKAAHSRHGRGDSEATFVVRKVDQDGRILKAVGGRTSDPEIIKDLIRRADEEGEDDNFHYPF